MSAASLTGLQELRSSFQRAALDSIRSQSPSLAAEFAEVQHTLGISAAVSMLEHRADSAHFTPWEELLELLLDVELALEQVRSSVRLIGIRPERALLDAAAMNAGAWVHFQTSAWSVLADGLLERSIRLIKRTVRDVVRADAPAPKQLENRLTKPLAALSDRLGKIRDPVAHGGGSVSAITKDGLIRGAILSNVWFIPSDIFAAQEASQNRWHARLHRSTAIAIGAIDRAFSELSTIVDSTALLPGDGDSR